MGRAAISPPLSEGARGGAGRLAGGGGGRGGGGGGRLGAAGGRAVGGFGGGPFGGGGLGAGGGTIVAAAMPSNQKKEGNNDHFVRRILFNSYRCFLFAPFGVKPPASPLNVPFAVIVLWKGSNARAISDKVRRATQGSAEKRGGWRFSSVLQSTSRHGSLVHSYVQPTQESQMLKKRNETMLFASSFTHSMIVNV